MSSLKKMPDVGEEARRVTLSKLSPPRTKRGRGVVSPTGSPPPKQVPRRQTPRRRTCGEPCPDAPRKSKSSDDPPAALASVRKSLLFDLVAAAAE